MPLDYWNGRHVQPRPCAKTIGHHTHKTYCYFSLGDILLCVACICCSAVPLRLLLIAHPSYVGSSLDFNTTPPLLRALSFHWMASGNCSEQLSFTALLSLSDFLVWMQNTRLTKYLNDTLGFVSNALLSIGDAMGDTHLCAWCFFLITHKLPWLTELSHRSLRAEFDGCWI